MSEIAPTSLLHPLKATVLEFQEDEHDYQFKVEYPEPTCCHACGAVSDIIRFNKKLVKYRDVPMHGRIWMMKAGTITAYLSTLFWNPKSANK